MHYRIIQIEPFPIEKECRITEDNYIGDHWFVYRVADYVTPDEDRAGSLEWLKASLTAGSAFIEYFTDADGEGFILRDGFHSAYFASEYQSFHDRLLALVEKASPESFADGRMESAMSLLNEAFDDKFGFYIDSDETNLVTLNSFLRHAKVDTPYYFGGTLDYHY